MGQRNYLIEGHSGAGKTTVATELERRGYHVIHGDRNFAYYGDPETGEPLQRPEFASEAEQIAWGYPRWIWPVYRVKVLIADQSTPMTFFCGGSRNSHRFIDLFDAVFVLEVDFDTLERRMATRPDDVFGGRPLEREWIRQLHASREGLPPGAISIDASRPVGEIVDDVLEKCTTSG